MDYTSPVHPQAAQQLILRCSQGAYDVDTACIPWDAMYAGQMLRGLWSSASFEARHIFLTMSSSRKLEMVPLDL